jgi:hypothetical protein
MQQKSFFIILNKLAILVAVFSLSVISAFAQKGSSSSSETPFHKGSNTIALGVGIGNNYNYYSGYSYYTGIVSPPTFLLSFDHGIKDDLGPGNLGIGGIIAMKSATYKYSSGGKKATWKNYIIGVRATYHLTLLADKNNKFDPYAGLTAGVRINTYKDSYYTSYSVDDNTVYPVVGVFVGAKYNFAKNFGAFVEAGYDFAFLRGGINFNF